MPPTTNPTTTTFRWLLDTRPLWRDEPFEQSASRALHLLPPHERVNVLKHIFTADCKLRLASFLLKRLAVHHALHVPWSAITLSTDQRGKPCYVPPSANTSPGAGAGTGAGSAVKFNVSHQAGLVVLIGSTSPTAEVGIDVVSVDERAGRDMAAVAKEGFAAWVDVYAEVFSEGEVEEMKWSLPGPVSVPVRVQHDEDNDGDGTTDRNVTLSPTDLVPLARCLRPDVELPLIASKIRNFYAHWCLKEAYIKMTGEALLAPWLRDLEFRNVRPPLPSSALSSSSVSVEGGEGVAEGEGEGEEKGDGKSDGGKGKGQGKWGETVDSDSFEIYRFGKRIGGKDGNGIVRVELRAWEEGFMIASAVSMSSSTSATQDEREMDRIDFGEFEELDLEKDVLRVVEAGG